MSDAAMFVSPSKQWTPEEISIPSNLAIACFHTKMRMRRDSHRQVFALFHAGWLFEPVGEDDEPWQWAWRSPPKKVGSKGRRYASTNQAFNAMNRSK